MSNKRCLNCQTELQGDYCHVCGQHASNAKPTVKEFILEYLNIVFIWDGRFVKTISQLVRKPGHVTKEYVSGKYVSYTHPLKLNMFLLFVFITLFLLFQRNLGSSIHDLTRDEVNSPLIHLRVLSDDDAYAEELKASALDTVMLYAPLMLADQFPDMVVALDDVESASRDSLMVWEASLPHVLIEDEVIILDQKGHYRFAGENKTGVLGVKYLESIWGEMVKLTTRYFPIIILLTVPFLAFLLGITHRRGDHSKFKHFIFSLHYTAFLEMLILFLYIMHLIVSLPAWVMQWVMILGASVYLTMAVKKVYDTKNWIVAAGQAAFTNFGYAVVLTLVFLAVIIISSVIVAIKLVMG